jgi:hypothetical protein
MVKQAPEQPKRVGDTALVAEMAEEVKVYRGLELK